MDVYQQQAPERVDLVWSGGRTLSVIPEKSSDVRSRPQLLLLRLELTRGAAQGSAAPLIGRPH